MTDRRGGVTHFEGPIPPKPPDLNPIPIESKPCPNTPKCNGFMVLIKHGPIIEICPECGYHIKQSGRPWR